VCRVLRLLKEARDLERKEKLRAIRNLIIELIVYGTLVTFYALSVLQLLADPLADLYADNLTLYAWLALFLIVGQGFVLEEVTSFLIDRLRLTRFD
jgi:hypothetical protein